MQTLTASKHMTDTEAEALAGRLLTDADYDTVVRDDCIVYRSDGSVLLVYRRGVLPLSQCQAAYDGLRKVALEYDGASNRGLASGKARVTGGYIGEMQASKSGFGSRFRYLKKDGTLSNTNVTLASERATNLIKQRGAKLEKQQSDGTWLEVEPEKLLSGVVGYLDRNKRFPYCRLTAFNLNHPERFAKALPLIRTVNQVFEQSCPERYAAQMAMVQRTEPDYIISGTAFTTLTVNLNFQTAVHKDAGDLKEGFGVMSALRAGTYEGCYTCFPQYRIAADMQTGDVLLADVHEWHGNTPLHPQGAYERLSLVFYYRQKMHECGTPAEERDRAAKGER